MTTIPLLSSTLIHHGEAPTLPPSSSRYATSPDYPAMEGPNPRAQVGNMDAGLGKSGGVACGFDLSDRKSVCRERVFAVV